MMVRLSMLSVLLGFGLTTMALAQEGKLAKAVLPFDFMPVHKVDSKRQVLVIASTKLVQQLRTKIVTRNVNGVAVKENVSYTVQVPAVVFSEFSLKDYRLTNVKGKQLSAEAFLKQAQLSKIILRAKTPKGIPPVYMKLFHPDTLILEPRGEKIK